jgi:acyl carrier protein
MTASEALRSELKHKLVETLDLQDVDPAAIGDEEPLFGEDGLGLDSIDVLEIAVMIERDYGVKIDNKEIGEKVMVSVRTLADHLAEQRKDESG